MLEYTDCTICRALPKHRNQVYEFHVRNHLETTILSERDRELQENDLPEDFPQLIHQEKFEESKQWIAWMGETMVGCIGIMENQLVNFSVHPQYRQRGIGTTLLKTALAYAKDSAKMSELSLITLKNRMRDAVRLYDKMGFQLVDQKIVDDDYYVLHYKMKF